MMSPRFEDPGWEPLAAPKRETPCPLPDRQRHWEEADKEARVRGYGRRLNNRNLQYNYTHFFKYPPRSALDRWSSVIAYPDY